uniref:G-protein coupled receptors family 1 profile domain-containing protein n=1 Tax=Knipowitschia caucasica TaxID=637954 RepID=A0AAV2KVX0_KNICA
MTMAGNGTTLSQEEIKTIIYVYIGFLSPSVVGSFSVLVVSLLRWRRLQEQRQLLVQLALADLLASAVVLSISISNLVPREDPAELCLYGLPLALVFYVLSFILVIIYAFKSKNVFQGWRTRPSSDGAQVQCGRTNEKASYTLLWVALIGVYMMYAIFISTQTQIDKKSDCCQSCYLFSHVWREGCSELDFMHQAPVYVVLFFMVVAVVPCCIVTYSEMLKWHEGQEQQQQGLFPVEGDGQSRKRFKHIKHTASMMVLVIIFCWTPALLLFILTWLLPQATLFPLYIIQAATVSLQGFLNSMVYAWKRTNFTEAVLGERTPLISYNHISFFEESLKSSP